MYRRIVSLLLLPCVLLTQSAALAGHAHADFRIPGHDLRPHIHTQNVPAGHNHDSHAHHHHHASSDHHHDDVADSTEPDFQQTLLPVAPSDHDSDAVYVTIVDSVVGVRCLLDNVADTSLWVSAAASDNALTWSNPLRHPSKNWHPPPVGGSCPLYVLHRTFLI